MSISPSTLFITHSEVQEWLDWTILSSVPLRKNDLHDVPVGTASSCLVNYCGRRFLMTATHVVTRASDKFLIELGVDDQGRSQVYILNGFNHVKGLNAHSAEIVEVDFSVTQIAADIQPVFEMRTFSGMQGLTQFRHIFDWADVVNPDPNEIYAFSGEVFPELHGNLAMVTTPAVYPNLRFVGTEAGLHQFKLPVPHPGHEHFDKCSGAPIVDSKKRVVALVSRGRESNDMIYGVPILPQRFALDFCIAIES